MPTVSISVNCKLYLQYSFMILTCQALASLQAFFFMDNNCFKEATEFYFTKITKFTKTSFEEKRQCCKCVE